MEHWANPPQSICMYVAVEHGLCGKNNWEMAKIMSFHEHIVELYKAYITLVPERTDPIPENVDLWFSGGAMDISGPAVWSTRSTRYLTWWLGRIEASMGNHGYAVGDQLSLADVMLFSILKDYLTVEESPNLQNWQRVPFTSKTRTDAVLENYPKIKSSVEKVANHPNIQKWLLMRGLQEF